MRIRGQGNACGAAWEWAALMAGERDAVRPAAWDEFGFLGEFNQAAPCGVSLPGLPADLGRGFQRLPALPPGNRCRAFGASLRCGSG